jgi:5-azacytidine-induced protein 1
VVSAAGTSRPVQLAETVFDGVRAKLRRLQEDVQQRDAAIVSLNQVGC